MFGIDWNGPLPVEESMDDEGVTVPDTQCPLSSSDFAELQRIIDPLGCSNNHGADIFIETLSFVAQSL